MLQLVHVFGDFTKSDRRDLLTSSQTFRAEQQQHKSHEVCVNTRISVFIKNKMEKVFKKCIKK